MNIFTYERNKKRIDKMYQKKIHFISIIKKSIPNISNKSL